MFPKETEPKEFPRRTFLLGFWGLGAKLLFPKKPAAERIFLPITLKKEPISDDNLEFTPDLENDVFSVDKLQDSLTWFKERMAQPEKTGVLEKEYYAVHTSLVDVSKEIGVGKEEIIEKLEKQVNDWFSEKLNNRKMRFEGEIERFSVGRNDLTGGNPNISVESFVSNLLKSAKDIDDFGLKQRLNIIFVKGVKGITKVVGNTVIMSLPDHLESQTEGQKAILGHLIGHALGLSHPRDDIDTKDTEFDVKNSLMHPNVLTRGLKDSLILDSQLNPHKAELMVTGFFPYEGKIYTLGGGAIPLDDRHLNELGVYLAAFGGEIKIAHGLYIHPCQNKEAFVNLPRGKNIKIDFGSAIIRQEENYKFNEFGEHITRGVGLKIEGEPLGKTEGITIKGGTFIGFYRGISAKEIRKLNLEGVTVIDGRRIQSDARKPEIDEERGRWLYFWNTPEEDLNSNPESYFSFGAGICLENCSYSRVEKALVGHTTIGIADYKGTANTFVGNDLSECAMGLRFWQAKGTKEQPILVKGNIFHHNAQPCPSWWMHGDGAAILAAGIKNINIEGNEILFGGDGVFFCGFPQPPGRVEGVKIMENDIRHCYAHGIELDFSSNCLIERNKIYRSWLSGIWAGHSSGVLVYRNTFDGNNCGRLFSGWEESQGAISCPEGQITVVGNTFKENWVAVNLWRDSVPPWFPFSGDSSGHIITGNAFIRNEIGIRLASIENSEIQTNLLDGNNIDVDQLGACKGIFIKGNGSSVDPEKFLPVVHLSHQRIFLTNLDPGVEIPLYLVSSAGIEKINPKISLEFSDPNDHWVIINGDRISISPTINQDFAGLKAGRLIIEGQDKTRVIPLKFMAGNSTGFINRGKESDPEAGTSLGQVPFPGARFGFSTPISDVLKAKLPTGLTGKDFFSLRLTTNSFSIPQGTQVFLIINSTDSFEVSLLPAISNPPPLEDGNSVFSGGPFDLETWRTKMIEASPGANRLIFDFKRCVSNSEDPEFFPLTNLLLVPLDPKEISRLSLTSTPGAIRAESLMSWPGTYRQKLLGKLKK